MSALLVAIVCFGSGTCRWMRGFVEIKILDQNLTLHKMICISQNLFGFCVSQVS